MMDWQTENTPENTHENTPENTVDGTGLRMPCCMLYAVSSKKELEHDNKARH
jgi:hypothetical protein